MQASVVAREFTFNGVKIPDPDRSLSAEEVRSVLATLYARQALQLRLKRLPSGTPRGTGCRAARLKPCPYTLHTTKCVLL